MYRKLIALTFVLVASLTVRATDYTWNPALTGSQTWDTSTANWSTTGVSPFNTAWVNGSTNNAIFDSSIGAATTLTASSTNISAGQLQLGTSNLTLQTSTAGSYTFSQGIATVGGPRSLSLAVAAGSSGGFTVSGTGNTTAGGLTINLSTSIANQGLTIQSGDALGTNTTLNVTAFGALGNGTTISLSGANVSSGVQLNISGAGSNRAGLVATSASTWNGDINLNSGSTFLDAGTTSLTIQGAVVNNASVDLNGSTGTGTISSVISGTGTLRKTGNGTWLLSNESNSFNTDVTVAAGTLQVTKLANAGSNSSVGAGTGSIRLGQSGVSSATLEYVGTSASTTDRGFLLQGTGASPSTFTISNNAVLSSSTLTLNGNVTTNTGTGDRVLVFSGTNTGINSFNGTIASSAGTVGVRKEGTTTWVLNGANTYIGGTTVTAGTLLVNNSTGSGTGTGTVTVNGGTLGGTGTISGATSIVTSGTVQGGDNTAPAGTLNFGGNLTVASGGKLGIRITNAGSTGGTNSGTSSGGGANNNEVNVTGTLNVTGGNFVIDGTGADFAQFTSYSYLVATAGTLTSVNITDSSRFTFTNINAGVNLSSISLQSSGGNLYLNFTTVPEPGLLFGLAAGLLGIASYVRTRRG